MKHLYLQWKNSTKKQNFFKKNASLILDNCCPGHPNDDDLNSKNSFYPVTFLSPNVTPMD